MWPHFPCVRNIAGPNTRPQCAKPARRFIYSSKNRQEIEFLIGPSAGFNEVAARLQRNGRLETRETLRALMPLCRKARGSLAAFAALGPPFQKLSRLRLAGSARPQRVDAALQPQRRRLDSRSRYLGRSSFYDGENLVYLRVGDHGVIMNGEQGKRCCEQVERLGVYLGYIKP